jgi:hypothetical protein
VWGETQTLIYKYVPLSFDLIEQPLLPLQYGINQVLPTLTLLGHRQCCSMVPHLTTARRADPCVGVVPLSEHGVAHVARPRRHHLHWPHLLTRLPHPRCGIRRCVQHPRVRARTPGVARVAPSPPSTSAASRRPPHPQSGRCPSVPSLAPRFGRCLLVFDR